MPSLFKDEELESNSEFAKTRYLEEQIELFATRLVRCFPSERLDILDTLIHLITKLRERI